MKRLYENEFVKELIEDLNDVSKSKYLILKVMDKVTAKAIKKRCDQLLAAPSFGFVVANHLGYCESLKGNFEGYYSIVLTANVRLIIKPNSSTNDMETLNLCKEYILKGVVDYHDKRNKPSWIIP